MGFTTCVHSQIPVFDLLRAYRQDRHSLRCSAMDKKVIEHIRVVSPEYNNPHQTFTGSLTSTDASEKYTQSVGFPVMYLRQPPPKNLWESFSTIATICAVGLWTWLKMYDDGYKAAAGPGKFPWSDNVLVKINSGDDVLLPTEDATMLQRGEVVAVGWGTNIREGRIKYFFFQLASPYARVRVGTSVLFPRKAATEGMIDGVKHVFLNKEYIVGVLSSDDVKDTAPIKDRVLVKVANGRSIHAGNYVGMVVAYGSGVKDKSGRDLRLEPGDKILFSRNSSIAGADHVIVRGDDIEIIL